MADRRGPRKPPQPVEIPAGTKGRRCNGSTCGAMLYFVYDTNAGRQKPYDTSAPGMHPPTDRAPGKGMLHHLSCPDVNEFRRTKGKKEAAPRERREPYLDR